jgi:hypothetical protein
VRRQRQEREGMRTLSFDLPAIDEERQLTLFALG